MLLIDDTKTCPKCGAYYNQHNICANGHTLKVRGYEFTDYASLSDEEHLAIRWNYNEARRWNAPIGQAIAIAAKATFKFTDRGWNGKKGSNAFAAACAALIMAKDLPMDY